MLRLSRQISAVVRLGGPHSWRPGGRAQVRGRSTRRHHTRSQRHCCLRSTGCNQAEVSWPTQPLLGSGLRGSRSSCQSAVRPRAPHAHAPSAHANTAARQTVARKRVSTHGAKAHSESRPMDARTSSPKLRAASCTRAKMLTDFPGDPPRRTRSDRTSRSCWMHHCGRGEQGRQVAARRFRRRRSCRGVPVGDVQLVQVGVGKLQHRVGPREGRSGKQNHEQSDGAHGASDAACGSSVSSRLPHTRTHTPPPPLTKHAMYWTSKGYKPSPRAMFIRCHHNTTHCPDGRVCRWDSQQRRV